MKTALVIALLTILTLRVNAQVDKITDPVQHYYKHEMSTEDNGNNMYVFKGSFTDDKRKSIFITDNQSLEQRGVYSWTVYCPKTGSSDEYVKSNGAVDLRLSGECYIGYIEEIKGFGLVYAVRRVVGVQYLKDGNVERVFLNKNGTISTEGGDDVYPENFPKYFSHSNKTKVNKFSLQKLEQMYP